MDRKLQDSQYWTLGIINDSDMFQERFKLRFKDSDLDREYRRIDKVQDSYYDGLIKKGLTRDEFFVWLLYIWKK